MKAKIQALLMAAGCVAVPQAQAGWFDWLGEMDASGFYAGSAIDITKATGQLNRRLGGENDFAGETLLIEEPGFITTGFLRGGWQPLDFLAVEAHIGVPLDSDEVENGSNTQRFKMKSLYGAYLRPQIGILDDTINLYARAGFSDFDFEIQCYNNSSATGNQNDAGEVTGCRDENGDTLMRDDGEPVRNLSFSDSGFAWGAGIELRLSAASRLEFEYTQYYDEDDARVFGVGIGMRFLFGQGGGDDYYY